MLLSVIGWLIFLAVMFACGFIQGRLWSRDNEAASKQIIANLIAQRDEAMAASVKTDTWMQREIETHKRLLQLRQAVTRSVIQLSEAAAIQVQDTDETP